MTRSASAASSIRPLGDEPRDQLRVVQDLPAAAEGRILVLQRVERVRIAGDDPRDAEPVQRGRQRRRELLEQHLVARAARAFAGRGLGRAENPEPDARLLQDLREGPGDLLSARVERLRRADVVQVVELTHLLRGADDGHAESARPVAARVGRQPPGIALRLVGLENGLELVRERPLHQHAVLAHPEEPRQMLELDRARGLAVAAGRARPERVLADDLADQRRKRVRRTRRAR